MNNSTRTILCVERAVSDLKRGFPILVNSGEQQILACSAESICKETLSYFNKPQVLTTANRINFIKDSKEFVSPVLINKSCIDDIRKLSENIVRGIEISSDDITFSGETHKAIIRLFKIAELLPVIVVGTLKDNINLDKLLRVKPDDINNYKQTISLELTKVCSTPIQLKYGGKCEFIAYRPNIGGKEHFAIISGNALKQEAPLVRIHSSCYTGDLLHSLVCDCHDQLHQALKKMADNNGGIVIYMMQEGREIGLINKIRAYNLKEQGHDTVTANEILGYEDDERCFAPAVKILEDLKISKVNLLTNNPKKISKIQSCGINVVSHTSHVVETNKHNVDYLKTKIAKMGHMIEESDL